MTGAQRFITNVVLLLSPTLMLAEREVGEAATSCSDDDATMEACATRKSHNKNRALLQSKHHAGQMRTADETDTPTVWAEVYGEEAKCQSGEKLTAEQAVPLDACRERCRCDEACEYFHWKANLQGGWCSTYATCTPTANSAYTIYKKVSQPSCPVTAQDAPIASCFFANIDGGAACEDVPSDDGTRYYVMKVDHLPSPSSWSITFSANLSSMATNGWFADFGGVRMLYGPAMNSLSTCQPGTGWHAWKMTLDGTKLYAYCDDQLVGQRNVWEDFSSMDLSGCPIKIGAHANVECTKMYPRAVIEVTNVNLF